MGIFVALLRGINVGKAKRVKMDALRELCGGLGWDNVRTYIQSGNVVFESQGSDVEEMTRSLRKAILDEMGHDVVVLVRTVEDVRRVLDGFPWPDADPSRAHVAFFDGAVEDGENGLEAFGEIAVDNEDLVCGEREVYLHTPGGFAQSKVSNAWFEKAFGVSSSMRNLRTVRKLVEMADS